MAIHKPWRTERIHSRPQELYLYLTHSCIFWILPYLSYVFFYVSPWRLEFKCQCFRTLCLFHLHRWVGTKLCLFHLHRWVGTKLCLFHLHRRVGMRCTLCSDLMEQTEYSETLVFKLHTLGNNPKENIWHLKHGEKFEIKNYHIYTFVNIKILFKVAE
jgi:hypothetical protein